MLVRDGIRLLVIGGEERREGYGLRLPMYLDADSENARE